MPKEISLLQMSHLATVCTSFNIRNNSIIIADAVKYCKYFFDFCQKDFGAVDSILILPYNETAVYQ